MSNWLLFGLLTVVVIVNVYFTYRRTTDLDDKGRKLLAASQLIYLVFIGFVFVLGYVFNATGLAAAMQGGRSAFWIMIAVVAAVLAAMLFIKSKLEKKIKEEHKL